MTLLEAMAAAKPVVATRVGAVPQIVIPEQTGLLVEPGDTQALRDALARMLSDRNLRESCGRQGQAIVRENFSADAMACNYLNLYKTLLNGRGH